MALGSAVDLQWCCCCCCQVDREHAAAMLCSGYLPKARAALLYGLPAVHAIIALSAQSEESVMLAFWGCAGPAAAHSTVLCCNEALIKPAWLSESYSLQLSLPGGPSPLPVLGAFMHGCHARAEPLLFFIRTSKLLRTATDTAHLISMAQLSMLKSSTSKPPRQDAATGALQMSSLISMSSNL